MIIGISGKKFHGKDTIGRYFTNYNNFNIEKFAYPVKQITSIAFNIPLSELDNSKLKENHIKHYPYITRRRAMEFVGNDSFRKEYPDIWVESLKQRINTDNDYVITDLRYPNEAKICDFTIRVVRDFEKNPIADEETRIKYENYLKQIELTGDVESETSLDDYDFDCIIENNKDLSILENHEEMMLRVDSLVKCLSFKGKEFLLNAR